MTLHKTLSDRQHGSYFDVGASKTAVRVNDATVSTNILAVTGESVTFSAGTSGVTGNLAIDKAPIYNALGTHLGMKGDTSFSFSGTSAVDTEVAYKPELEDSQQYDLMNNGEYAIDYDTGKIRYKKNVHGGTSSDTASYKSRMLNVEITGPTDIEIGAVELKNGADDTRAIIKDGSTAATSDVALVVADANVKAAIAASSIALPTTIVGGIKSVTLAGTSECIVALSTPCKSVSIRANAANTGFIYVGGVTVSSANGIALAANDQTEFNIANLDVVYIDSSLDGEGIGFTYFN